MSRSFDHLSPVEASVCSSPRKEVRQLLWLVLCRETRALEVQPGEEGLDGEKEKADAECEIM